MKRKPLRFMANGLPRCVAAPFYNGNAKTEPGAIVCRVAPSFTRMGSFQLFPFRGELEELKQFLDFTIAADFPHLLQNGADLNDETQAFEVYGQWFAEVCRSTAELMVHWILMSRPVPLSCSSRCFPVTGN